MSDRLKRLAAHLPSGVQQELKRYHHASQIRRGRFRSEEPEHTWVAEILRPGDWAIDIGANVGHYTLRFASLVGDHGRVVAIEPIPPTFELLAANAARLKLGNVTLLNVGASDRTAILNMWVPEFDTGLKNYYMAHVTDAVAGIRVLSIAVDDLSLPGTVRLAKIDAEGHEAAVLRGMERVLDRDRPWIILESGGAEVPEILGSRGYSPSRLPGSPNLICTPPAPRRS